MIKLSEIVHSIRKDNEEGLTEVDNWSIVDADFMEDVGFKPNGMYHYSLENPKLTVCHKKGVGFILKDNTKNETKQFPEFKDFTEYLSKYEQQWENTPYL